MKSMADDDQIKAARQRFFDLYGREPYGSHEFTRWYLHDYPNLIDAREALEMLGLTEI
jgi:hypothetical protein